jgi:hypothetical protein
VVPKVRVSCWRPPAVASLGTRMMTSTSALAMSRPATRSANSGSSCASCIDHSYDEKAMVADAVVRRSQGQVENLVRGLEAPFSGPEGWLPASDSLTGSGPPRGNDVSERPQPQLPRPAPLPRSRSMRTAASGAAGSRITAGQPASFSRRSGVTPGHGHLIRTSLLVGRTGFEPVTSSVSGWRFSRLGSATEPVTCGLAWRCPSGSPPFTYVVPAVLGPT